MAFPYETALGYLQQAWEQGRMGHAYLLTGPRGGGQERLALAVVEMINGGSAGPAGVRAHPDVHLVGPESKSRRIVTEQMRDLENALRLKPTSGRRKIGVILQAECLQVQASNAFLKTLEEPPADSLLLLVTHAPESLLTTIISRCLPIALAPEATDGRDNGAGAEKTRLLGIMRDFFGGKKPATPGVPLAFGLLREINVLLAELKAGIAQTHAETLAEEEKRYRQTTDGGWLAGREDYYKGLTESRYLDARELLIENLLEWNADVLRVRTGATDDLLRFPSERAITTRAGEGVGFDHLSVRVEALEELPGLLSRNIQETLALEATLLRAFGETDAV